MFYKLSLSGLCLVASLVCFSQSAAINTDGSAADASAALHIKSTTKGLLIPTLTGAQRTAIASPAKALMVYQTDGVEGFYYNSGTSGAPNWTFINAAAFNSSISFNTNGTVAVIDAGGTRTSTGAAWLAGGNTFAATTNFGTVSNNHVDLITFNTVRGRLTNLGEFFIGTTNTALPGDLMGAVGNATFPWAVNGYTNFNGGGVYGAIQGANNTAFAAVQGENNSTTGSINSAAVRGINNSITAGNGFRNVGATGPRMGVNGTITQTGSYSFGVYGSIPSITIRTGGLFGDDGGIAMGSVGYYASNGNDYSFYAFGNVAGLDFSQGGAGGRLQSPDAVSNTHIGMGVYGGVMGGWIRGQAYGAHVKGDRYSLYVDGQTVTNKPITQIVETQEGERLPTYTPTSLKTDVTARGRSSLEEGRKFIAFERNFAAIISPDPAEMTITVTPTGNSNGVYVESVQENGFWVKENNNGNSNVSFNWIAIGTRKGFEQPETASEVLERGFDQKMNGVMHHELNTNAEGKPIWWDGQQVRFDTPPAKQPDKDIFTGQRPTGNSDNSKKK
jgi:hypothetical protein